jgi:hypothetical protein
VSRRERLVREQTASGDSIKPVGFVERKRWPPADGTTTRMPTESRCWK